MLAAAVVNNHIIIITIIIILNIAIVYLMFSYVGHVECS